MSDSSGLYVVKTPDNFFMVKVQEISDSVRVDVVPATFNIQDNYDALLNDDLPSLPFGRTCLSISSHDNRTPIISTLDYFKNCAMGDSMNRRTGTYHMVCATLSLCQRLFGENFTRFRLQDASQFWCGKRQVDMWLHNLLVYGETYYERKFGATPDATHDLKDAWANLKTRLATEMVTQDFVNTLIQLTRSNVDDPSSLIPIMENAVANQTWNEMFNQLHFAQDGKGCRFFSRDTLREIHMYFRIFRIDSFEIGLTTTHRVSLVAHEKILDGQEADLVTLESIHQHQEEKY